MNREQNHSQLVCYDAITGNKEKILYEEKHEKYVEPQHPLTFLPWEPNQFIYQSQRDGYNHLYLFDTFGKEIKQLTQGEWLVKDILGFNQRTKEIIIMSTELSPLQNNTFAVNTKTGKRRLIGASEGVHHVQLSVSGKYIIDNYTSHNIARNIDILPVSGKGKSHNLLTAENPMNAYNMPEITLGTIKAGDGKTDLYYLENYPLKRDKILASKGLNLASIFD